MGTLVPAGFGVLLAGLGYVDNRWGVLSRRRRAIAAGSDSQVSKHGPASA
ncbi:MAG: hypothetical protein ABJA87_07845 [bacterium]